MTEYERGYEDCYKNASKTVDERMNDSDISIEKLEKLCAKLDHRVGWLEGFTAAIEIRLKQLEPRYR